MSQPRQTGPGVRYVIAGMAAGLLFLLASCGLMGWHYLVSPVPRPLALLAVVLGAAAATAILVAVAAYWLGATREPGK